MLSEAHTTDTMRHRAGTALDRPSEQARRRALWPALAFAAILAVVLAGPVRGAYAASVDALSCSSSGASASVSGVQASGANERVVSFGRTLANVPDYSWWYGCAPTSAGMLIGYYDRNGYAGRDFSNLVPGAIAEATTFPSTAGLWQFAAQDVIASIEHVRQFWPDGLNGFNDGYGLTGDDVPGTRPFNSLADFMGTSQDGLAFDDLEVDNGNGNTQFVYRGDNGPTTQEFLIAVGAEELDGGYGILEYFEAQGYDSDKIRVQNQRIFGFDGIAAGFTFDDFAREVLAGRPALIHVTNHTMLGFGFEYRILQEEICLNSLPCTWVTVDRQEIVALHDTWSPGPHSMIWGRSYADLDHRGVTTINPYVVPEPAGVLTVAFGLLLLAGVCRRQGAHLAPLGRASPVG